MSLTLLIAFLGGVLPALVWLFFWLMEDRCEPEPKRYIVYAFIAGMIAVAPTLLLEKMATYYAVNVGLLVLWATIEEVMKYAAAYIVALRRAVFDEPLDAVIYLVTAALGFSAMENVLFLFNPLASGEPLLRSIVTEDLRFMGASLLHCLTSVTIGLFLAWSFYKQRTTRINFAFIGLILAITLHTLFNFFILKGGSNDTIWVFLSLWLGVIIALLFVERIKQPKDYC